MTCWLCGLETTELATNAKSPICKNGPCQICAAATEVDEEINQVVATLRRLLDKRCDILSEHNRVHAALIHRLPVELKNRIFELLLPLRGEWGEIDGTGMQSFLATISVCKEWRDVTLSNPFLWSTMHIDLETLDPSNGIKDWILRSQALPLTLHIRVADTMTETELSIGTFLDALSHCSNRLQSLSLEVPLFILRGLLHNNLQYHCLKQLKILPHQTYQVGQSLSLLNPTASPEKIEVDNISFRSLHISWNRLISATICYLDLEDLTQLFRHASQMTFCNIFLLMRGPGGSSMPPVIHHRLKTLKLHRSLDWGMAPCPLGSLTLPCLQEVEIYETILLAQLPALVRRSSCPLTRLTLYNDGLPFDELQPLPGVTDLVVGSWNMEGGAMMKLLLYFPDLHHLTLQLQPFEVLWDTVGVIPLLDLKRRPDGPSKGRLDKFIVVINTVYEFDRFRNSDVGEGLKELNVTLREDGFEFF